MVGVVVGAACSHQDPTPQAPTSSQSESAATAATNPGTDTKGSDAAAVADDDPAPCDAVARRAVANSRTDHSNDKDLIAMLRGRCIADRWSVAARTCYLLASNWDEALPCESKLTPYQVKSLEAEIEARGGVMGHPPRD